MAAFKVFFLTSTVWFVILAVYTYRLQSMHQNGIVLEELELLADKTYREGQKRKQSNSRMPSWTQKHSFLQEAVPDDKKICFVHVGKTAGSTLACYLGFRYTCFSKQNALTNKDLLKKKDAAHSLDANAIHIPPGHLATYTTNIIHTDYDDCADHDFATYLVVVRDPLRRMQSWFTYERPSPSETAGNLNRTSSESYWYEKRARLFVNCEYDTLDALGGPTGLGARGTTLCSRRADRAIRGVVGYASHNYYNFGYYWNLVPHQDGNVHVAVIRTEHMEQDWANIEKNMLDGPEIDVKQFPHKNWSKKKQEDHQLSDASRRNICAALCKEILVYKQILNRADNLSKEDIEQTMSELRQSCPEVADAEECPDDGTSSFLSAEGDW